MNIYIILGALYFGLPDKDKRRVDKYISQQKTFIEIVAFIKLLRK